MSGDPSFKDPVIFYSEELTKTKLVLLKLKGIKLNFVKKRRRSMWNLNIKETFIKVKDWDKAWAKKIQDKFNLTDYQMLCLAFAKGFVIGAILL